MSRGFLLALLVPAALLAESDDPPAISIPKGMPADSEPAPSPGWGVSIVVCCGVEALAAGDNGRRVGFDSETEEAVAEVPFASYVNAGGGVGPAPTSGPNGPRTIDLNLVESGDYRVTVIGTSTTRYRLEVNAVGRDGQIAQVRLPDAPIAESGTHHYVLEFDMDRAADVRLRGGILGGGGGSDDQLLAYFAEPSSSGIGIAYGDAIDHTTFSAELDGVDATARFNPEPGSLEWVNFGAGDLLEIAVSSKDGANTDSWTVGVRAAREGD